MPPRPVTGLPSETNTLPAASMCWPTISICVWRACLPTTRLIAGAALPKKLDGFDVIVFSGAFDNKVRDRLLADLSVEYPYRTRILGADRGVKQDGGVIIVSRWPITAEAQHLFGESVPAGIAGRTKASYKRAWRSVAK